MSEKIGKRYKVFSAEVCNDTALKLQVIDPQRFHYHQINWGKFSDGTDNITLGGYNPTNEIAGHHVLFLASFHNNDVTLSQFSVFIVLLQSFIESLTIILPFYPVGTMERMMCQGSVATGNTYAMLFSSLPSCGRPIRLMIYDIHALQNRFYFHGNTISSLHTSIPLLWDILKSHNITAVAFPDDGAAKRFSHSFVDAGYDIIICGKVRDGNDRKVTISDGNPSGKNILIVDDLVQTGGTLHEAARALLSHGALEVNAYVTHGVFPNNAWKKFSKKLAGDWAVFENFWMTDSIPTVATRLPKDDVFQVLELLPLIILDLDAFEK